MQALEARRKVGSLERAVYRTIENSQQTNIESLSHTHTHTFIPIDYTIKSMLYDTLSSVSSASLLCLAMVHLENHISINQSLVG